METKIETVKITHNGKTTVWDIVEDPAVYLGRRAYLRDTTNYYDLDKFEAGLAKADHVDRAPA